MGIHAGSCRKRFSTSIFRSRLHGGSPWGSWKNERSMNPRNSYSSIQIHMRNLHGIKEAVMGQCLTCWVTDQKVRTLNTNTAKLPLYHPRARPWTLSLDYSWPKKLGYAEERNVAGLQQILVFFFFKTVQDVLLLKKKIKNQNPKMFSLKVMSSDPSTAEGSLRNIINPQLLKL